MAKFYFHLHNHGNDVPDSEGVECSNANVVATKAMAAARDIISHDAKDGAIDLRSRIDVEDTSARVIHSLEFEDAVRVQRAA